MARNIIQLKKVRNFILWTIAMLLILGVWGTAIIHKKNSKVDSIVIDITGLADGQKMISEKEVLTYVVGKSGLHPTKSNLKNINIQAIEARILKDERVKEVRVYIGSDQKMHIHIVQKKPILRVMSDAGNYYIDRDGDRIESVKGQPVRVPILTGYHQVYDKQMVKSPKPSLIKEVYKIMTYISDDKTLSALIEQVHITNDSLHDIVLVPKMGRQNIIFGNADGMDNKFDKLKIFYKDGLPKLGWNRYSAINLKYNDQIAAKLVHPSLAYQEIVMPSSTHKLESHLNTHQ